MPSRAAQRGRRAGSSAKDKAKGHVATSWRTWLLGLLLVAALLFAAFHWGDVKKFAELLSKAKPMWLLGAFALQVGTYVTLAIEWRLVLRQASARHRWQD